MWKTPDDVIVNLANIVGGEEDMIDLNWKDQKEASLNSTCMFLM